MNTAQRLFSLLLATAVTAALLGSQLGLAARYDNEAAALAAAAQTRALAASQAAPARRG